MEDHSCYVYALKDPRTSPALPFYIGKGTGARAYGHELNIDQTSKGRRIQEIQSSGHEPIIARLIDNLTELQALKLEAELISAFGTEATGGLLTNTIVPSGIFNREPKGIVVPSGLKEKAQLGLELLKSAILELAQANPKGVRNSDTAKTLGLQSDYQGKQRDYLTYSILGILLREGKISRAEGGWHRAQVR